MDLELRGHLPGQVTRPHTVARYDRARISSS